MRKRISSVLWGLIFIAAGVGIVGDMAGAWEVNLLFAGWWTLFLIVPALLGMVEHGIRIGNTIGLIFCIVVIICAACNEK